MNFKKGDSSQSSVVADIGAANIRFARLTAGGLPGPVVKFATAKFPDFTAFPVNHLLCVVAPIYWITSDLF